MEPFGETIPLKTCAYTPNSITTASGTVRVSLTSELHRVWFFGLAVLNKVYNLTCLCPKQGHNLSSTGYGI